jgi:hypothetical protein
MWIIAGAAGVGIDQDQYDSKGMRWTVDNMSQSKKSDKD